MIDWHIVCDFDGTITRTDVIDSILQRFADPGWEAIENAWLAGDIGSRECLSRQLSLVKATPAELLGLFDSIEIDPHFPDFVDHAIGLGASFEVVSDGIEQAIARILARHYVSLLPILANRLRQVEDSRWRIDFPHASDACRGAAGNCKCKSAPMARRVLVIGDGQSDMCVASTADFVFAKDRLAEHCERNNIAYARFDSFAELPALLALLPSVSAANTFKRATQEFFQHV
ncbi:2-hydroxy-3-keto-5-methylthiopentenyl-1-phosphate phosphatase [compost metagenome]|jgi:2-hydroxy-3-keto-5-methylthiopentenyl-1-phosphate phosphatase|uniref:MtnX-like HAD-IB family phosphatase n=1 Tax=Pseudomonas TaxID=286 RepID=UPI0009810BEF|nr:MULTISPECIES: MtnX-like HAD-IB family phosphatase [Pseudomonas]MCK8656315.1 MtnX-like HAD-IB family phosphatase [Pseudomonas umsongensis]NBB66076.1 MtnX-like HAD-IB family phosphatase [Pseudomonas sp. ODNR1LW]OMQ34634.1 2,3-diketo-5-methylthio-1-phosphopentane phosphatase [Pseudomonas putida]